MAEYLSVKSTVDRYNKVVPVDQLRAGPRRYAGLRQSATGSWKVISSNGDPVAIAWTDWEDGFDIIVLKEGTVTNRLGNYVITARALDIPAPWAYTTLDTSVKRFDEDEIVKLSEQENGKLSGAVRLSGGAPSETESEEVENGIG